VNTYTSEEPDEEGGPLLNVPMRIASRQTRSAAGDRTKSELNSEFILLICLLVKSSPMVQVGRRASRLSGNICYGLRLALVRSARALLH
jgi:hypothetical protein